MPPVVSYGPPGRLPARGSRGDRLGQDAAEPGKIDQAGHFAGVAECARGDQDRIGKEEPAQLHGEIDVGKTHALQ